MKDSEDSMKVDRPASSAVQEQAGLCKLIGCAAAASGRLQVRVDEQGTPGTDNKRGVGPVRPVLGILGSLTSSRRGTKRRT
jgi:hypothetical protein